MEEKEHWSSRTTFILASIGAAIGIGNVWRFPFVVFSNGGGAFLIPYVIALITAGIPLLMLEFALGYRAKAGAPISFRALMGPRFEWIGWLAVLTGFCIIIYYCVILAWSVSYMVFSATLAFKGNTEEFFFNTFLNLPDTLLPLGAINLLVLGGAVIAWLWIYLAIIRGVRSVEKMVWITVLTPWILILIFVIRGVTLPGAMEGLAFYLTPDFSFLLKPTVWLAAYGQIFFTLSLGWAVMITYASFLPPRSDIAKNAIIISVANALTSFIAGIAVFSTLGYLANQAGVPVSDVVKGGIELAFVTYPAVIQLLPIAPELFGVLFFLMLLTLGVDSAFATIEATSVPLQEQYHVPRFWVNTLLCIVGLLIGTVFVTQAGYYWLDITDYYLSVFSLVSVVLLETLAVGYFYGPGRMRRFINDHSEIRVGRGWEFSIKVIVPAVLLIVLISTLVENMKTPYGGYPAYATAVGWAIVILLPVFSLLIARSAQKLDKECFRG